LFLMRLVLIHYKRVTYPVRVRGMTTAISIVFAGVALGDDWPIRAPHVVETDTRMIRYDAGTEYAVLGTGALCAVIAQGSEEMI
jgi:hypothetical protein